MFRYVGSAAPSKSGAEGDVFIGTEAEKVLDVAVEVVGRIADASIGNETLAVVEADEAVPADHLADHIIRQVPLVGTDGARVGVGRNERAAAVLKEVGSSRCRLNGDINEDPAVFHFTDCLPSEICHSVSGGVSRNQAHFRRSR